MSRLTRRRRSVSEVRRAAAHHFVVAGRIFDDGDLGKRAVEVHRVPWCEPDALVGDVMRREFDGPRLPPVSIFAGPVPSRTDRIDPTSENDAERRARLRRERLTSGVPGLEAQVAAGTQVSSALLAVPLCELS